MKQRVIFLVLVLAMMICVISSVTIEEQVPALIRLHILANSDSREDQVLKYKVRDHIVKTMQEKFAHSQNLAESREILLESLPELEKEAEVVLRNAGSTYQVKAAYGQFSFPTKYYGNFALPAGRYEAVRLVIGEGAGANWWCVLFPPLCFVDGGNNTAYLQEDIAKELKTVKPQNKVVKIKPAFKVVEIWQDTLGKIANK
jgi:stage II sporulation protein R